LSVPAAGAKRALITLDRQWSILPTPALKLELEKVLNGHGRVELAGAGSRRAKAVQQQALFEGVDGAEVSGDMQEDLGVIVGGDEDADL
jgi:hypothetical protein